LLGGRIGNKRVRWAIVMVCIVASTGIAVYGVAIINRHPFTPTNPALKESLQATYLGYGSNIFRVSLTNNGTESIFVSKGTCSSGYCMLVSQAALNVGQSNVTVEFSGPAPSGPTVFNVTTFNGNTFQWNTSSPAFNPHIGHETLVFDSYDGYIAYSNPLYVYSLNVTNTGTANVTIEGGSCTTGNCGPFPTTLYPNVVTVLKFGSPNPCPGYITFSAVTALGNIFDFYVKAC
jgi:hypothetical protein